jgi:hypothetical protein
MNTSATFVLVHGKQKGDSVDFEDLGADTPHFWGEDLSLLEEDRRRIGTASTRKNAAPRHFPRREPRDAVSEIRRKPQGDSRVPEGQVAGKQSACGSGCYTLRGHCLSASLGVIRLFGGRGESATRRLRSSGLRPEKVLTVSCRPDLELCLRATCSRGHLTQSITSPRHATLATAGCCRRTAVSCSAKPNGIMCRRVGPTRVRSRPVPLFHCS